MNVLAPKGPTRNRGSRLWIISEEMSMNMLTSPSTQMPAGIRLCGLLVVISDSLMAKQRTDDTSQGLPVSSILCEPFLSKR